MQAKKKPRQRKVEEEEAPKKNPKRNKVGQEPSEAPQKKGKGKQVEEAQPRRKRSKGPENQPAKPSKASMATVEVDSAEEEPQDSRLNKNPKQSKAAKEVAHAEEEHRTRGPQRSPSEAKPQRKSRMSCPNQPKHSEAKVSRRLMQDHLQIEKLYSGKASGPTSNEPRKMKNEPLQLLKRRMRHRKPQP